MKDVAILMSPPMVRAILREENPKTVTRRTRGLDEINQDPDNWTCETRVIHGQAHAIFTSKRSDRKMQSMWSPYGRIGTRLWVRENHWIDIREKGMLGGGGIVIYEATPEIAKYERGGRLVRAKTMETMKEDSRLLTREEARAAMLPKFWKQKPSIHLPRWASRITLEQVDARGPERLQDITEADAKAEGALYWVTGHGPITDSEIQMEPGYWGQGSYRMGFADIYEGIHGAGAWEKNPWVWPIGFKNITPK